MGGRFYCSSHRTRTQYFTEQGIPAENWGSSFESYSARNESQERALALAHKLIDHNGPSSIGLYLHGDPGLGKTHLAVSIAKAAHARGMKVLFLTPENMIDFIRHPKTTVSAEGIDDPGLRAVIDLENRRSNESFKVKTLDEVLAPSIS